MPKAITFNGKTVIEPGAYTRTVGGETNAPDAASFGNVLIIDTGSMAGYGWRAGINGQREQGIKSVYTFESLDEFRQAMGGGIMWHASRWLFKPKKDLTFKGVDKVHFVQAATTTYANTLYTFTGGVGNGGTFKVKTMAEGLSANGVLNGSELVTGFSMLMVAGIVDTAKFKIQFYRGAYKGVDFNSVPFDNVSLADAGDAPELLVESIEFNQLADLYAWAISNETFNTWFEFDATSAVAGTGVVDAADLAANLTFKLFAGATEVYGSADYTDVFRAIKELDYTFVLSDQYEANANNIKNTQLLSHIILESEFKRFLVIGGGAGSTNFTAAGGSIPVAEALDSELVHVVHSRVKVKETALIGGLRTLPSLHHAAAYLGLVAGGEPQVPATWKALDIDEVVHELNQTQRETALKAGVIHERFINGIGLVINQDINTKQENEQDIYENGTSPHGSIMRIAAFLEKDLTMDLRSKFVGSNANLASPADVISAIETNLLSKVASKTDDNIILSFKNIKVNLVGSDYKIEFGFTPNGPVNRLFITGFMFNVNL